MLYFMVSIDFWRDAHHHGIGLAAPDSPEHHDPIRNECRSEVGDLIFVIFAPQALFENWDKSNSGPGKKSVRLDIDTYIYIRFLMLFERLAEVCASGIDL